VALTKKDIGSIPPHDANGEMMKAATLLKRWRKAIDDSALSAEWKRWLVESLLAGLPVTDAEAGAA